MNPPTATPAELALLGLLAEEPKYPYQIAKDIETRGMDTWTELSLSAIYKLLRRLERGGLVKARSEKAQGDRIRHVYHLTPNGKKVLHSTLSKALTEHEIGKVPFDAAIYNSDQLPPSQVRQCLEAYRGKLKEAIEFWFCMIGYLRDNGCPGADQALCARRHAMLEGEMKWLNGYIREFDRG